MPNHSTQSQVIDIPSTPTAPTTNAQQSTLTREQWDEIGRRLREPFEPRDVDFRVQGKVNEQTNRAQVVAYIDARAVQDRLDAVVGAGNWSFDWTPLVIENGDLMVTKGTLIVHGVAKSDVGSASNFEQSLGAVSHCFKRAAVHWGVGRYLYNLPVAWVAVERGGRIPEPLLHELRAKLPRPTGSTVVAAKPDEGANVAEPASGRGAVARPRPEATIVRESATSAPVSRPAAATPAAPASEPPATEQQLASIGKLCAALGKPEPAPGTTFAQARQLIVQLSGEYQRARKAS
jgi:hypothetical protein